MNTEDSAQREPKPRFQLLDDQEIETLPPMEWLIDGVLPKGGSAVLFGDSGTGKTFTALDWSFHIGSGRPWLGRAVKQGAVVYVAGEGGGGYSGRVIAWKREHGHVGSAGVKFLTEAVQLLDTKDVDALIALVQPVQPSLITFDTLARCMVGGDEDRAKDMGILVSSADRIRREVGCAVLTIHHPTKNSGQERGSGSLRGAIDTLLRLTAKKDQLILTCEKQRDGRPFDDIRLALRAVSVNEETESCVVEAADPPEGDAIPVLSLRNRKLVLTVLVQSAAPLRLGDWRDKTNLRLQKGVSERDFQRIANDLLSEDYVAQPNGRKGPYQATDSGRSACVELS